MRVKNEIDMADAQPLEPRPLDAFRFPPGASF